MNNLLEEDEDDIEGDTVDDVGDGKESNPNGAHLSSEQGQNGSVNGKDLQPPNLVINRMNGLKTETCI
jgi:hypothetical protein